MREFHNMDCMEGMKNYSDNHFDLAIVDPPYGIGNFNPTTILKNKKRIKVKSLPVTWNNETPGEEYFTELKRISKKQIIFGANYYNCFEKGGALIWYKGKKQDIFSKCEIVSLSFQQKVDYIEIQWQSGWSRNSREKNYNGIHPTQKPIKLYQWLLQNYATKGDLILDTHVGSASSLIACEMEGFDCVGFELDKDYYQAAQERLSNFRNQLNMFRDYPTNAIVVDQIEMFE